MFALLIVKSSASALLFLFLFIIAFLPCFYSFTRCGSGSISIRLANIAPSNQLIRTGAHKKTSVLCVIVVAVDAVVSENNCLFCRTTVYESANVINHFISLQLTPAESTVRPNHKCGISSSHLTHNTKMQT